MRTKALVGLVLVLVAGCGDDILRSRREAPAAPSAKDALESAVAGVAVTRATDGKQGDFRLPSIMIIRTGQVSIEVDSLERAVRLVNDLAARSGGYVANSTMSSGTNAARTATIEIKIPSDRYQGTIDGLRAIGKVLSAATNSQDVGEEFFDLTARIANAKRLEERIVNLLATRTGKLEDVLNVERELARIREEIERYEGRSRYLTAQVAMSTVAITVFEPGPIVGQPGENVIVAAFKEGWRNFVAVVAGGIAVMGGLLPFLLVGGLGLLSVRWALRRHRSSVSAPPAAVGTDRNL